MGGSWLAIVQGFAGMRTIDGLSFAPFLPNNWESFSFKVNYRERLLKVYAGNGKTRITLEKGTPVEIIV
jgi:maltose phosphorylase